MTAPVTGSWGEPAWTASVPKPRSAVYPFSVEETIVYREDYLKTIERERGEGYMFIDKMRSLYDSVLKLEQLGLRI
jgi:hypothetical protein